MRAVNFPKRAYRLERRLGCGAPRLNLAPPPPSGGRGAKAGLACALMRLNLAPRSPHQRTAPARDFAQQSWKGLEGRRGLGWNPSNKGIRRSRSESRVGLRIDALEPWLLEVRISGPPRPVTLRSKVGKGLRGAGVWGGTPVKRVWGGLAPIIDRSPSYKGITPMPGRSGRVILPSMTCIP